MARKKSYEEIISENQDLRLRLQDAEETLLAIRNHEVDALMAEGPEGDQVFTLQGAEQPYRVLVETMNEAALTVTPDGAILYCNNQFSELLKLPLNRIMGASFSDFLVPQDHAQSLDAMLRTCGKEGIKNEFLLKRADGHTVPVLLACRSLTLNDVDAFCIVATDLTQQKRDQKALEKARDHLEERVAERTAELSRANAALQAEVTVRRQAEEKLAAARGQVQSIIDNTTAIIYAFDLEERFLLANTALAELLNSTPEQMIGKRRHEFMPKDDADWHEGNDRKVIEAGKALEFEENSQLNGRSITWLTTKFPLRDAQGRIYAVAGISTDVSARKKAEEELRRSRDELEMRVEERTKEVQEAYDKLLKEIRERERIEDQLRQAHKMEAVGTLAGGIAHDFNNMLAAIIGNAELAMDGVPEEMTARHNLDQIFKAGMRARGLVRQILTFSRKTEHEHKTLPLTPLVKETFEMLRSSLPTNIEMSLNIETASDTVLADPVQMQQVLMNLCTNAGDAMRYAGGRLEVTLTDMVFSEADPLPEAGMQPGTYVTLTVTDTGPGMHEDVKGRIFEPFFTTKERGQGTGMGLAVVYGIVKSHQGVITVSSQPGQGATFTVHLPHHTSTEKEADEHLSRPVSKGKERILLVDDEELLVEVAEAMLERLGYKVVGITDSVDALQTFAKDPAAFDLVITDHTMPQMTGATLAQKLREARSDIPIILCTGYSETISQEKAEAMGIDGFVMKPVSRNELAQTVRRVLDGIKAEV